MSEEIDCELTDEIVCPYCGCSHDRDSEGEDLGAEDSYIEYGCGECEKTFVYVTNYSDPTFSSSKFEEHCEYQIKNAKEDIKRHEKKLEEDPGNSWGIYIEIDKKILKEYTEKLTTNQRT